VVYTGTHDNDTTMGWEATLPTKTRRHLKEYLGERDEDPPWGLIRVTLASVSEMAIVPMQDLLSLPSEARMNIPGQGEGNWEWRLHGRSLTSSLAKRLRELAAFYGRGEEENNLPASGVVVF
jgi:4-alpha-glucanotransferase